MTDTEHSTRTATATAHWAPMLRKGGPWLAAGLLIAAGLDWPRSVPLAMAAMALLGTTVPRLRLLPTLAGGLLLPVYAFLLHQAQTLGMSTMAATGTLLGALTLIPLGLPGLAWQRFLRLSLAMALLEWVLIGANAPQSFATPPTVVALLGHALLAAIALMPALKARPDGFASFAAAAAAGTAVLVAVGWWTGNAVIVQAATVYVPMQFNTALTMFCLATAFWLSLHRRRALALSLLLPVFVFAPATLLEEFAGLALNVGRWLMSHPIVAEQVQPGRMAPNTAIGALLVATGILVMPIDRGEHPWRAATTWLCGITASVLAAFVLAGYLLDLPMMRSWGSTTPMALMTALSLLLLGLALATLRLEATQRSRGPLAWAPALVGLAAAMLVVSVWLSAQQSNRRGAGEEIERQLDAVAESAAERARERTNLLKRAGLRAIDANDEAEQQRRFARDARDYLDDYYPLQSLALATPEGRVVGVAGRDAVQTECLRARLKTRLDPTSLIMTCGGETLLLSRVTAKRDERRLVVFGAYALMPVLVRQVASLDAAVPLKLRIGERVVFERGVGDGAPLVRSLPLDHAVNASIEAQLSGSAGRSHGILTGFLLIGTIACALLAVSLRLSWLARERAETAERRQSELEAQSEVLQRLQANLLRAQEIAGLGHWEFEPERGRMYWSEALDAVFGIGPGRAPESIEAIAGLVHADDRQRWLDAHRAVLVGDGDGDGDLEIDFRGIGSDGTTRHLHERARLLRRADGNAWLLAATVQDISERERMVQALAQNEERFRLISRATADALWDWDLDSGRVWYSDGMETRFGVPRGLHDGNTTLWSTRIHPADRQRVLASIDAAVDGGLVAWESDYRFLDRNDQYLHVHDRGFVLRDAAGRAVRMVGGMSDVTPQREMQHRQERINRALRLLSACSDAMFAADDESWLLEEVCRLALLEGRYELAWIGYALEDWSQTIRPMAVHGRAAALVLDSPLPLRWTGTDHGPAGAPGRAVHGAVPIVVRDFRKGGDPWAEHALADGLYAAICLPLHNRERVFGVLALYVAEPIVSAPPELSILQDLADNLSRGIGALRLRRDQERLQQAIAQVASSVYSGDEQTLFDGLLGNLVTALDARGALLFRSDARHDRGARLLAGKFDGVALPARDFDRGDLPFDDQRGEPRFSGPWPGMGGMPPGLATTESAPMMYGLRLHDRDGRGLGALCLLHDHRRADAFMWSTLHVFAARTAAEMERIEREQFIREQATLLDKAIEAIFVCDPHGRVRYWNEGAARLFGRTLDGVVGQPLAEVAGIDDERVRTMLGEVGLRRELRDEVPVRLADGTRLQIETHWSLVRSGRDDAESVLCIAIDITERQRMLARLQDSETRLQAIFDTAAEGIVTINADGIIESANPHALALFGYTREELDGRNVNMLMPEPLARAHDGFIARYLETGRMALPNTRHDLVGRRSDGSTFPIELSVRDVRLASGRLFTGFVRDITERRQAEAAMKQLLRDLDHQNQGLQEFVYIASHDLQEPLRKIRVFADRVLQSQGTQLDDQNRDFLARAIGAATRMQTLIDDLLAYSRVTAKTPEFRMVALSTVMAAVIDDLSLRIDQCGARIVVETLPVIAGDETQLRQLFQNLIGNALKYASPGRPPEIRISASAVDLSGQPGWCIRVADNGIGFEPRHAEKIFAPFQRLHGHHEYEGSGIGLAIVKRITNRHGGSISASGEPGVGATFMVILPASQSARPGG